DDADAPSTRRTQFYSMLGSRGIYHDGWKAMTNHATMAGWSHFNDDEWELYHTEVDRSEVHNVAADQPEKARETIGLGFPAAGPATLLRTGAPRTPATTRARPPRSGARASTHGTRSSSRSSSSRGRTQRRRSAST